jgi:hypothetical protein
MTAAPIHSSRLSASQQPSSSGSNQCALISARWHSLKFLQRGIKRVPRMAADGVCDHLGFELARVVKAGRGDHNWFWHCDECQIDRRSTGRAEGVDLFVPAVARYRHVLASPVIVTSARWGNVNGVDEMQLLPSTPHPRSPWPGLFFAAAVAVSLLGTWSRVNRFDSHGQSGRRI